MQSFRRGAKVLLQVCFSGDGYQISGVVSGAVPGAVEPPNDSRGAFVKESAGRTGRRIQSESW